VRPVHICFLVVLELFDMRVITLRLSGYRIAIAHVYVVMDMLRLWGIYGTALWYYLYCFVTGYLLPVGIAHIYV
jgi:hypothetical protein